MEWVITSLMLIIGVIFFVMAFYSKNKPMALISGFIFIIVGISTLSQGLQIPAGSVEHYNITTEEATQVGTVTINTYYETMNPFWSRIFALGILFFGVLIIIKGYGAEK